MPDSGHTPDPVLLALVQNRLDHISRQMGWVMTRTARSAIFNQSHDFSCFIANADGVLVSQADGIPIHTGGGGFAVRALRARFGDEFADGDVYLLNDPYVAGGNHLPDWVIARPIYVDDDLAGFTCNRAHQSDIGGGAAGTYNPTATEIFHEGLRLPPLKLIEQGQLREDLWELLALNCRTPELLDGDLRAMIGSTRIGAERVIALIEELGQASAQTMFDGILDHADRRFRQMLAALPDGRYEALEVIDNDCFDPVHIEVKLALTVDGDRLTADFTGSGGQMRGFKNSSLANTYSAVYMGLASFFEPDLPRNEGTFRGVEIIAPLGSVVNPRPPAPVTMCTVFIAHEIVHTVWRALSTADPTRSCAGWGKSVHGVTAGRLPGEATDASPYVMYHWNVMSGGGAVEGRDGFNQIGHLVALGGLTLPNVETYEQLYPAHFIRQEFRCDAAGSGQYRGGTGVDYAVEIEGDAEYSFRGEGIGPPSGYGVYGGDWGLPGTMSLYPSDGAPTFEAPAYGKADFGPLRLEAQSAGGGGWGDPLERRPDQVRRDVMDGVVSIEAAYDVYGVVLAAVDLALDSAATEHLRQTRRNGA